MKKILLIDDEKDLTALLEEHLNLRGYEVYTASDGDEGVRKTQEVSPDLIVCDMRMPNKDGMSVLKEVRASKGRAIPFIMLTGVSEFEIASKAYEHEADLYLDKPLQIPLLLKNIEILLNLKPNRL